MQLIIDRKKGRVFTMDDKVVRYTVLGAGVLSWFYLLYLVFLVFQHVALDGTTLAQVLGFVQAIITLVSGAIGGIFLHTRAQNGNGSGKTTSGGAP